VLSHLRRTFLATVAAGSLVAAGLAVGTVAAAPVGAVPVAAPTPVTITPDPAYQGTAFEGWGTSLAWFANATGGYPAAVRQDLFDKVFGSDGLNLNIARYNIGGGNATDVPAYLRQGAAVDGWWNPDIQASDAQGPITTKYADRDRLSAVWNADDPASYDFTADQTQLWWVNALKSKITDWEAFSNSPPYFMTQSGYVSGGFSSTADQLKSSSIPAYVTYVKTVAQHIEDTTGIRFDSIDPFNEPNTNYWGTTIDPATGWPKKGGQEGAHMGPGLQDSVIKALSSELAEPNTTTHAMISAMDETNPSLAATDWNGWSQQAKDEVGRVNVHTYSTSGRTQVRDIAKAAGKGMWMSEVEGDWDGGGANNLTNINNGIGMASHITDDLRELEPSAWILWQPVEDYYNMQKVEKGNWGSVYIDFDCNADGNSLRRLADGDADPSCKVLTNSKYNTIRNYTHYIHPGDHIIPSTNIATTTAVSADGKSVTLVHVNAGTTSESVTIDLSKFDAIAPGATVTPVVTTQSPASDPTANALVVGTAVPVNVASQTATLTLPAKSVSTLVLSGVTGIAPAAVPLVDGHSYQIRGEQSAKNLTATGTAATITTAAPTPAQTWTAHRLTSGNSSTERYTLVGAEGKTLTATTAGVVLKDLTAAAAAQDRSAQWMLSSTNGTTYGLVSVATGLTLEVGGQSTADGATVGVYGSNNGANQLWTLRDTAVLSIRPVAAATVPGTAPILPATVVPVYAYGPGAAVPVTWDTRGIRWSKPGVVRVTGSGVDSFGNRFDSAVAIVEVGRFASTDPVSVTILAGSTVADAKSAAPTTVPAHVGTGSTGYDTAVTWDWSRLTAGKLATPGVVTIRGSAASNDPKARTLPAQLAVIVTAASERNVAIDSTTVASASSTEGGYSANGTRNGNTADKGWSNWVPTNKPTSSTLSYSLGAQLVVNHVTLFAYEDGATNSWPSQLTVQYADSSGAWVDAPNSPTTVPVPADGTAPVVDVPVGAVATSQVRVVMTAYPNTHLTMAEVQVFARSLGLSPVSSAAKLTVDGVAVPGFTPGVTQYSLRSTSAAPVVAAVATDHNAAVTVTQPTPGNDRTATIAVTSQDGTSTTTYTLHLIRAASRIAVSGTCSVRGESGVVSVSVTSTAGTPTGGSRWRRERPPSGAPRS
jgi:O-glycosyl hydrolase